MFYCNTVILYNVYNKNIDNSSIMTSILNRHVFSYIYIHCILKTSGKFGHISM